MNKLILVALFLYSNFVLKGQNNIDSLFKDGILALSANQFDKALTNFNQIINLQPSNADAYYNRGLGKNDSSDTDGACLDWIKAGELGNTDAYDRIKEYCK